MPSKASDSQDQPMQDVSNNNEVTGNKNTTSPEPVLEFGEQRIRIVRLFSNFRET